MQAGTLRQDLTFTRLHLEDEENRNSEKSRDQKPVIALTLAWKTLRKRRANKQRAGLPVFPLHLLSFRARKHLLLLLVLNALSYSVVQLRLVFVQLLVINFRL